MRKPARALLIGTGFGAQHAEWISHCDNIELSVIAFARRESAARELAARYGAPYITKEPLEYIRQNLVDLVCIVSPPPTHEALLITCLNHGLPTMCDKPLSDTLAGARRIAEAWRHANAPTYSMFQWRLHPAVQALKAILSAGQDWSQITLSFEHDFLAASESPWIWRHTGGMGGGAMSDLGAHLADLLLYLTPFGWEVDSAEMNVDRPMRRAPDGTTFVCSRTLPWFTCTTMRTPIAQSSTAHVSRADAGASRSPRLLPLGKLCWPSIRKPLTLRLRSVGRGRERKSKGSRTST